MKRLQIEWWTACTRRESEEWRSELKRLWFRSIHLNLKIYFWSPTLQTLIFRSKVGCNVMPRSFSISSSSLSRYSIFNLFWAYVNLAGLQCFRSQIEKETMVTLFCLAVQKESIEKHQILRMKNQNLSLVLKAVTQG